MAHEDLNTLPNELLPFAKQMLAQHGEFYRFGGFVKAGGAVVHASGSTGDEHPPSRDVIDVLVDGFRQAAARGEIRAAAVCVDVLVVPPGETAKRDAVSLRLEHANGESVVVFLPYRKGSSGGFEYGELFASRWGPCIFGRGERAGGAEQR